MPKMKLAPYKASKDDPPELSVPCPACRAPVGFWCGGFGDIHRERTRKMGRKTPGGKRGKAA